MIRTALSATILAAGVLLATFYGGIALGTPAAPSGGYTRAQAHAGELVYIQYCLSCHGERMQGAAGPPLAGPRFGRSLTYGKMTTPALYDFIRTSMPMNAPGSLTASQYLAVLAFLLNKNGYAPGTAPLTAASTAHVRLEPYPGTAPEPLGRATPAPVTRSHVPAGAKVTLTDAALRAAAADDADWLLPGRTYDNARYSPLRQITRVNVASLRPVKVVHTGMVASFETTPIVADGIMYLTTPAVDQRMKVLALNAATGETLWSVTRTLHPFKACCGPNNRGVALAYGNVYLATLDDELVALDARTGAERWATRVADPSVGYSESMAPQVYDGLVIVGSAGGEWALRGFVAAYDAQTGRERWRWYATDPHTFAGDSWKRGGGTVWTTPAIDPARNLLIFGTGNPNPDMDGAVRAGDNLYTDSMVALDIHTGRLRWHYQEVKHDVWDYDATSNVVLFDVRAGSESIPAAGQAGKVGWFFIVDRRSGRLLRKSAPFVTQNANMFGKKEVLPGANGGSEWSPPAYSPQTGMVYVLGMNQLMNFTAKRPGEHPGYIHTGSGFTNTKAPSIQDGTFSAIDTQTGRIAWQYKAPKPMIGGALVTAGDVVFTGEGDGSFDAFDARAGTRLWRYHFLAGVNAPPITYRVGSDQYVAVAAGGSYQLGFEPGDAVGIFRLKR